MPLDAHGNVVITPVPPINVSNPDITWVPGGGHVTAQPGGIYVAGSPPSNVTTPTATSGGGGHTPAPTPTVNVNIPKGPKPLGRPAEHGFWQPQDQYNYQFDSNWYSKLRGDNFTNWATDWLSNTDKSGMHFGDYVRLNKDLEAEFQRQDKYADRWAYGKFHWDTHGKPNNEDRFLPMVIGAASGASPNLMNTILTRSGENWKDKDPLTWQNAMDDLAQWHYENYGKDEAAAWFEDHGENPLWAFGSEAEWFNSPGQVEKRNEQFRQNERRIAAQQQAYKEKAASAAESLRLQGKRMMARQDVQIGGAADVRSHEIAASQKKRGTSKFKSTRPKRIKTAISDIHGGLGNVAQTIPKINEQRTGTLNL